MESFNKSRTHSDATKPQRVSHTYANEYSNYCLYTSSCRFVTNYARITADPVATLATD